VLDGRCAPVQRAAEYPPVVRCTALSNMRIKLTAKLKKPYGFLASCSLSAAPLGRPALRQAGAEPTYNIFFELKI